MNKRNLITIIILVILMVAIPVTLYLVRQTQIFRPKAAIQHTGAEFVDGANNPLPAGANGIPDTTLDSVNINIQYDPAFPPPQ